MVKKISLLLMAGGIFFLIYAGWQMWHTKNLQNEALQQAEAAVSDSTTDNLNSGENDYEAPDPQVEEAIGILEFPSLSEKFPIIEGTSDDALAKGVGHYEGSAYPGKNDQIVLSAHRDTMFKNLGKLQQGDDIQIKKPYGTFSYTVERTDIVEADDQSVIRSTAPKEELVLTTCYPFDYIGPAPKRYIVYALPTDG